MFHRRRILNVNQLSPITIISAQEKVQNADKLTSKKWLTTLLGAVNGRSDNRLMHKIHIHALFGVLGRRQLTPL